MVGRTQVAMTQANHRSCVGEEARSPKLKKEEIMHATYSTEIWLRKERKMWVGGRRIKQS